MGDAGGEVNIYSFLSAYKDREFGYIPIPGTAGDSVIAHATLQVFDEVGLNYKIESRLGNFNNKLLVCGGGGNFVRPYTALSNFLKRTHADNEIVILPHTINSADKLIGEFGSNVKIICRERKSYEYVSNLSKFPENIFLSDDLAFHITGLEKYNNENALGICNAFRLDPESTDIEIPPDNTDLSRACRCRGNTWIPSAINNAAHCVFSHLSKFKEVNTNRLHVSIAGALLGIKVNLYPNSYYKNKAIYEFSMNGRFKNVNWFGE